MPNLHEKRPKGGAVSNQGASLNAQQGERSPRIGDQPFAVSLSAR